MKRVHLLPNVITAFALSCGLFVIFKVAMTDSGNFGYQALTSAVAVLMLAAFADLLDGAVARAMKAESDFGGLFDCMSDAVTFGVGPSIVILKSFPISSESELSVLLTIAAMIFSVCGVLRLVRFSILAQRAKGDQDLLDANKKNFTGLPIPGGAAAALSGNLFLLSDEFQRLMTLSDEMRTWVMIGMLVVLGYLMISRWKFPSFKSLQIRVASFQIVFLTVVFAVIISYGLLRHFAVVFFMCSWSYVIIAGILGLVRMISGRKSKTLEDFEPEPEDLIEDEE